MKRNDPLGAVFIDTHAHLDDPRFAPDLEACLERAAEAGVAAVITVGTDLASSEQAVELASRYADGGTAPEVYAAVGIHPHEARSAGAAHFERLAELARELFTSSELRLAVVGPVTAREHFEELLVL